MLNLKANIIHYFTAFLLNMHDFMSAHYSKHQYRDILKESSTLASMLTSPPGHQAKIARRERIIGKG